jgi:hypothetical protein
LLGEGGEGTVFRTDNSRYAVKLCKTDYVSAEDLADRLDRLRWLPLDGIPICRPLEALAPPHTGYVMELLEDMVALKTVCDAPEDDLGEWYSRTGGLARRLTLLARCAGILSTLHERGIVYGDVSPGNVLISERVDYDQVWLVDADNLQTESIDMGRRFGTPYYTAPELLRRTSGNTAASDLHSFAVIAYQTLTTNHPFLGDYVSDGPPEYEDDAQLGLFPWIDHGSDDRNRASTGRAAEEVTTSGLRELFSRAFEEGMTDPRARPRAGEWAQALWTAVGRTVHCAHCAHTFPVARPACPWCAAARPAALAVTVEERYPRFGEFPSVVLPRGDLTLVLQTKRKLVVRARTTGLDPEDGDQPVLTLEWDGGESIQIRNVGAAPIRRVPPKGGAGMSFFPGARAADHLRAPWLLHFGDDHRPHRILCVTPAGTGGSSAG